jgi:hypothetical protein
MKFFEQNFESKIRPGIGPCRRIKGKIAILHLYNELHRRTNLIALLSGILRILKFENLENLKGPFIQISNLVGNTKKALK